MKLIKLTKDKFAKVDDEDFEVLSKFKWHANLKSGTHFYAQRSQHVKVSYKKYSSKTLYMHREILKTIQEVDHINGDTLDNRKQNLRAVTRLQQCKNTSSRKGSSSSFVGVHLHKLTGKWRSQITVNGKTISLGLFDSQEKAALERNLFIDKYNLTWFKKAG